MQVIVDGVIFQRQSHGGISRIYNEVIPRLCAMDESIKFTILASKALKRSLPAHARIHYHRLLPIEFLLRPSSLWWPVIPQIREGLQKHEIDNGLGKIWHSTYYTRLKGWLGKEIVTVVDMTHELFPDLFNRRRDKFFRQRKRDCILNADAVICISATTQKDLHELYGKDLADTYVVPLAHSHAFKRLRHQDLCENLPTEKPFLLYVGRRFHYKNFEVLIKAYAIWSQHNSVDMIVIGDPWTENEKRFLIEADVFDRVYLLTGVSDMDLAQLYNQALAFVYPSLYEGFGIPLLEAMACGCPIVASHIPSTVEVAGKIPIYFEPTEVESLLFALHAVYSEGSDSRRVEQGLEHVRQYSWDRTARQTLEVYRALSSVE